MKDMSTVKSNEMNGNSNAATAVWVGSSHLLGPTCERGVVQSGQEPARQDTISASRDGPYLMSLIPYPTSRFPVGTALSAQGNGGRQCFYRSALCRGEEAGLTELDRDQPQCRCRNRAAAKVRSDLQHKPSIALAISRQKEIKGCTSANTSWPACNQQQ